MSGTRVALVLVLAAGAATCFFRLGTHGLWFDEITGARLADFRTAGEVVADRKMDSHPPATALAEHWCRWAFGLSEWSLRLPAALASTLALVAVFALAAAWGDGRVGVLAAALAAVAPPFVFFAHNARPYALAMFFSGAASVALLYGFTNRRKYVWFPLYALCAAVALYTHYFTTLVLGAHIVIAAAAWLPALRPPAAASARRYAVLFLYFVVALGVAAAAAWPVFETALFDRARFPGGEMRLSLSLVSSAFTGVTWDRGAANVLFAVAAAAGVIAVWRRGGRFAAAAAVALAVIPVFLPVLVIRLTTQYWNPRFSYFGFPAVMAVAAFGFVAVGRAVATEARRRLPAALLLVALAAGGARAVVDEVRALRFRYATPVQDFRGAVALINRNRNWQTKILVWPYRNWGCYNFYTKTQGGPSPLAKPRFAVMELLESWPRLFIVSTDGEFTREVVEGFPTTVKFRLRSVDVIYHDASLTSPEEVFRRVPAEVVGVAPAVRDNALGRYAWRLGRVNVARRYFEAAAARGGPEEGETFTLAQIYADAGDYEAALRLAGGYVRRHPHEAWPYSRLAEFYAGRGDRTSAVAYYRRAVWLDPGREDWRSRLRELAEGQRFFRGLFGWADPRWM
ncbi:MAG: glycosyltransferase family 39 protein [Candidatus Coatesbacteria bacterium]|nr:MAG: glycosyltransferase family 39 protein [Candidatus Coatesbacteria bacterium]